MKVRLVVGICSLSLLWAAAAAAQDEDEEEAGPISGKAALGYLATSGNTDSTNANASFNLIYDRVIWNHEFDLSAVAATNAGATTAQAYAFNYEARRDLGEKGYLFTSLDWEQDKFSAFDQQVSETVGYGRRLVRNDRHALNVEAGAGARQADRRDGTTQDEGILRTTLDYVWTVNDTTSFSQDVIVDSGSSNTRVQAISELRARLFGNVALVLSYRVKRNSDVAPGIEKTDSFSAISLEYAF